MELILKPIKPQGLCSLDGCYNHLKRKTKKFCSKKCFVQFQRTNLQQCANSICNNQVKEVRHKYCSKNCFLFDSHKNHKDFCFREGCFKPFKNKNSTRKYCSQECFRLDGPNRPKRKNIRICALPDCNEEVKSRVKKVKYCSLECANKASRKLQPDICPGCEKSYQPIRSSQVYCSLDCRKKEPEFLIKNHRNLPRRFSKVKGKWKLTAHTLWEQHNEKIPKGMEIWFRDNNEFNDLNINNLYLVKLKEYLKLSKKLCNGINEDMSLQESAVKELEYVSVLEFF